MHNISKIEKLFVMSERDKAHKKKKKFVGERE